MTNSSRSREYTDNESIQFSSEMNSSFSVNERKTKNKMQTALTAVHAARAERSVACIYLRVHLCTMSTMKYEDYTLLCHYGLCNTHSLCGLDRVCKYITFAAFSLSLAPTLCRMSQL